MATAALHLSRCDAHTTTSPSPSPSPSPSKLVHATLRRHQVFSHIMYISTERHISTKLKLNNIKRIFQLILMSIIMSHLHLMILNVMNAKVIYILRIIINVLTFCEISFLIFLKAYNVQTFKCILFLHILRLQNLINIPIKRSSSD